MRPYAGIRLAFQRDDHAPGCSAEGARQGTRERPIPNIEAEVWKEISAGLQNLQDDDGDSDSLPLARNLDANVGVQVCRRTAYKFSTEYAVAPQWTTPQRRAALPLNFRGASLITPSHLRSYFSRGRLDPSWPWFERGEGRTHLLLAIVI